jgi:hypothetical protein
MCARSIDSDDELRLHLASSHGLEDDEGVTTTINDLRAIVFESTASSGSEGVDGPARATEPRIYDQSVEDEIWKPISLGIGGVLLALLIVIVLL